MNRQSTMSSPAGVGAPYGHACANCALSKCKCIIRKVGGPCERCHRMNKPCRPAETVRRRNSKRRAPSKTTKIEEKLDDLVSLIKSGVQTGSVITSPVPQSTGDDPYRRRDTASKSPSENNSVSSKPSRNAQITPSLTPLTAESTGSLLGVETTSHHEPCDFSLAEAEECLENFQTSKLKYFPCVYIPPYVNAQQLQNERPVLWLSIMRLGCRSTSRQQLLANKIRQTIAQAMVVESEKSIDLLLGLLVFMGWANYQLFGKTFLSLFSQLATSLVYDLGINKPIPTGTEVLICSHKYSKPLTHRTMEHRRAVLACYLLTSIISSTLHKIDPLRWTPHMDECLRVLDEEKECPNDDILVQQVRLQLITDKTDSPFAPKTKATPGDQDRSEAQYIESLCPELLDIKANILNGPQNNEALFLHLYITELNSILAPLSIYSNQLPSHPVKSLNAGLRAIKCWFDFFFTIPPNAYVGFTFAIYFQLLACATTLYRLTTLNATNWDGGNVQETADLLQILDCVINNLEQVSTLAGLDNRDVPDGDLFSRASQIFRSLRHGWETELVPGYAPPVRSAGESTGDESLEGILGVEFFDNEWLMDLLMPPNY